MCLRSCNVRHEFSFTGCVLPSGPSPCSRLSPPQSTTPDKTPHQHKAAVPFYSNSPPSRSCGFMLMVRFQLCSVSGFLRTCLSSCIPSSNNSPQREPMRPPGFSDVSLPACHGLFNESVKWFFELKIERIELKVLSDNDLAQGFWGKMGFKPYMTTKYKEE